MKSINDIRQNIFNAFNSVWHLYADGFRSMTIGRTLWAVIIIKLAVIFLVLKLFFFPDILSTSYDNDDARADAVRSALTK